MKWKGSDENFSSINDRTVGKRTLSSCSTSVDRFSESDFVKRLAFFALTHGISNHL